MLAINTVGYVNVVTFQPIPYNNVLISKNIKLVNNDEIEFNIPGIYKISVGPFYADTVRMYKTSNLGDPLAIASAPLITGYGMEEQVREESRVSFTFLVEIDDTNSHYILMYRLFMRSIFYEPGKAVIEYVSYKTDVSTTYQYIPDGPYIAPNTKLPSSTITMEFKKLIANYQEYLTLFLILSNVILLMSCIYGKINTLGSKERYGKVPSYDSSVIDVEQYN